MLYYISNKNILPPEEMIDQFNSIENLTQYHYEYDMYKSYVKEIENNYQNMLKRDIRELAKIGEWENNFDGIPYSFDIQKILNSLYYEKTDVTYTVKEDKKILNVDFGDVIFDDIKLNEDFFFCQYNSNIKTLYKIFTPFNNIPEIYKSFTERMIEKNHLYLLYNLHLSGNKTTLTLIDIDIMSSTVSFEYPENYNIKQERSS